MNTFTIIQPKVEQKEEPINIIDLIPIGRENAISRNDLTNKCIEFGLIEKFTSLSSAYRTMRKLVSKVRVDYTILNLSNGNGYYRVSKDDLQDLQRYIKQEDNRAKASFRNTTLAKKLYEDFKAERI